MHAFSGVRQLLLSIIFHQIVSATCGKKYPNTIDTEMDIRITKISVAALLNYSQTPASPNSGLTHTCSVTVV